MEPFRAIPVTLCFFAVVLWPSSVMNGDDELEKNLKALDAMRSGMATPFAEVERRARELLQQHPAQEDQGKIYYQLAHTYAQGGLFVDERARRLVEYAKKALDCPLEPVRRLRLSVYLGCGLWVADQTKPLSERRTAAALAYLEGLKQAGKYNIPDEMPLQPPALTIAPQGHSVAAPTREDFQRLRQAHMARQKQWRHQRELFALRAILVDQIVGLYGRKPHAATELRELAALILDDPDTVRMLMKRLEEKGAFKDEPGK